MGSSTVIDDAVEYLARLVGYDAEECIQKAIEDGLIEVDSEGGWERGDGVLMWPPQIENDFEVIFGGVWRPIAAIVMPAPPPPYCLFPRA